MNPAAGPDWWGMVKHLAMPPYCWTPQQIAELTLAQLAVVLADAAPPPSPFDLDAPFKAGNARATGIGAVHHHLGRREALARADPWGVLLCDQWPAAAMPVPMSRAEADSFRRMGSIDEAAGKASTWEG